MGLGFRGAGPSCLPILLGNQVAKKGEHAMDTEFVQRCIGGPDAKPETAKV